MWPFFTSPQRSDASTQQISEDILAALEICGSSLNFHQRLPGTEFNLSHPTSVLCSLMPDLASQPDESWLYRSDLLDRYAMTKERYGLALQRTAAYVLKLPKHILLEVLNGSNFGEDIDIVETAAFRLIGAVLHRLLDRSPPTTDLYFLMGLIYPVMRRLGVDTHQDILNYMWRVSMLLALWQNGSCAHCRCFTDRHPFSVSNVNRYAKSFLFSMTRPRRTTSRPEKVLKGCASI